MKWIQIIVQIFILYGFSFIGEMIHRTLHLLIPGNVLGLLLLLLCLSLKLFKLDWIEQGAGFLIAFLPLLFVPAMIGIMNYPSLLSKQGVLLFFIVFISTIMTVVAAGHASQLLEKSRQKRKDEQKA
ncbi:CidA/LrgA family holin-like protein [Bacillus smithii]|uniref:CidA/LrgA family protein n=1 Tax=Bacillus smithii TaxID=1479 RepID=UPI002E24A034|nr:CidA/LrgA family holin-like protein [Bacillus smithii]MED1456841.1 CidA/LrgA family holin-like protein [Bacillus smithii]